MRESVDSIYIIINADNYPATLADKEYEYKTSADICQKKGLFGYNDFRVDGGISPERLYEGVNAGIDQFVQFCRKYDLPYEVNESTDFSGDRVFTGGVKGRTKTVKKEIVCTVTSEVAQKLLHESYAKRTDETQKYFTIKSGDWYDRIKNSEAVKAVADEMISYIDKYIENEDDKTRTGFSFKYQCNRWETQISEFLGKNPIAIAYEDLGYESLGSEEQEAAVTAAVIPHILKEYKSRQDVFDISFSRASVYNNYNQAWIGITLKSDEPNVKKSLKSW